MGDNDGGGVVAVVVRGLTRLICGTWASRVAERGSDRDRSSAVRVEGDDGRATGGEFLCRTLCKRRGRSGRVGQSFRGRGGEDGDGIRCGCFRGGYSVEAAAKNERGGGAKGGGDQDKSDG